MNNDTFLTGVAEYPYAFEVEYCRGGFWHATRRMIEKRRLYSLWSILLVAGIVGVLLPVQLSV